MPEAGTDGPHGPLAGLRFVEFAGIGPVPFAGMIFADLGARGIRLESPQPNPFDGDLSRMPTSRGRPAVAVDLKQPAGAAVARRLVGQADFLLEGFRPGVMERFGLGPDECCADNPRLVYARMTGWGRTGPLADRAGHDLTYLARAGALHAFARRGQPPTPPLNLVADYGGGAMLLVAGVLAALVEAARSGRGQVVDAAMVDGTALLLAPLLGLRAQGLWRGRPGENLLDSGAPFYDTYRTADGGYLAIAALEPRFYALLLAGLGLSADNLPDQYDEAGWPLLREKISAVVATRTRSQWAEVFDGTDACVAPVLDLDEARQDPQIVARNTYETVDDLAQPAPAPRFSRTPASTPPAAPAGPADANHLLGWGFPAEEVAALLVTGAVINR